VTVKTKQGEKSARFHSEEDALPEKLKKLVEFIRKPTKKCVRQKPKGGEKDEKKNQTVNDSSQAFSFSHYSWGLYN
jgi:hypothetical protein